MIEPLIRWRHLGWERLPFEDGGRALSITVYAPDVGDLTTDERFALALTRELAHLDGLQVADTDADAPRRLIVDIVVNDQGFATATLVGPDGREVFCGYRARDW